MGALVNPNRGFFGTTWGILRRQKLLLGLGAISCIIIAHVILSVIPPFSDVRHDTLLSLVRRSFDLRGARNPQPGHAITLAGFTLLDNNDWLHPAALGFSSLIRPFHGLTDGDLDASLWSTELVSAAGKPQRPLPTDAFWRPFVVPPGTGANLAVNLGPHVVSVITKNPLDTVSDRAGLRIQGPLTRIDYDSSGTVSGISQPTDSITSGFFMGVYLTDVAEYITNHYVASFTLLSVKKVWEVVSLKSSAAAGSTIDLTTLSRGTLETNLVRGSAYVTMKFPSGTRFMLATLPKSVDTAEKNELIRIENLSGAATDPVQSCASLSKGSVTTDALDLRLSDGTFWVLVLNQKVELTCSSLANEDIILSTKVLASALTARLAVTSMCTHETVSDTTSSWLRDAKSYCASDQARSQSDLRWTLMKYVRSKGGSVVRAAAALNNGKLEDNLQTAFVKFPLRDQLKLLAASSSLGGFTLLESQFKDADLINAIRTQQPDVVVFPESFADSTSSLTISGELAYALATEYIATNGGTVVFTGGAGGPASKVFEEVFGLFLNLQETLSEGSSSLPAKLSSELSETPPYQTDLQAPRALLPSAMPTELEFPSTGKYEVMGGGAARWPFRGYCKPSSYGSSESSTSCDGFVYGYYYWGNGAVQWIGYDWKNVESVNSNISLLLARALWSSVCIAAKKASEGRCSTLKRVLLVTDVNADKQADMVTQLKTYLVEDNLVDILKMRRLLTGMAEPVTENIGEDSMTSIEPNGESETLKDAVLRHAFLIPDGGQPQVEVKFPQALLRYRFPATAMLNAATHSLYPPIHEISTELIWDPYRLLVYVTPLHQHMEYPEPGDSLLNNPPVTLEEDQTCLVSVMGPLCIRSFQPVPECITVPINGISDSSGRCRLDSSGSISTVDWDVVALKSKLQRGMQVDYFYAHRAKAKALAVSLPESTWDFVKKMESGDAQSLSQLISEEWKESLRWGLFEDLKGQFKLDLNEHLKKNSTDDLAKWSRTTFKFVQLFLASDLVGLRFDQLRLLRLLKKAVFKFFTNSFDNKLFYDATYGGLVSCGCDRESTKDKKCVVPPRPGYFSQTGSSKDLSKWMGAACPALTQKTFDGGLGVFKNHLSVFGYLIYMAALVARENPAFFGQRVRIVTSKGLHSPRLHYLVLTYIRNFATPAFSTGDFDQQSVDELQRFFPPARNKDWWRLHSYSSGLDTASGLGAYQDSVSEAAFAYWAAALYAEAMKDAPLAKWLRFLSGTEIMASNTFWHVKQYTLTYPPALRYLGALGRVGELAAQFEVDRGVEPFKVFSAQILPLTSLSFEVLEPGWVLWMAQRWKEACSADPEACGDEGDDLNLLQLQMFALDWPVQDAKITLRDYATSPYSQKHAPSLETIRKAVEAVANIKCFRVGNYDCGPNTLSTALLWAAQASVTDGAAEVLRFEDGNGRFSVF